MASISLPLPAALARAFTGAAERHGRRLPALLTAVVVVLIAQQAARFAWSLIPLPEAAAWRPPPAPARSAGEAGPGGPDLAPILAAQLFGQYRAPEPTATALMDAPETRLNLKLMGIFAGTRERDSRALIAASDGREEPYSIGDDVARGVQLQAIFPDRVILSREGRLETLRLELDKPSAGGTVASMSPAGVTEERSGEASSLAEVREQVLRDPARAQEYIRVQPATIGGQMRGYRIYPGRDRTIFTAAGLRPGDLVTSINGVELNDPARALQLLGELSQVSQVTLTVERAGQPQTINVSLN